ncbi:phosphate signaling complex protein PhoU [Microaerobacter geothermalis]|uniref:phosphate signaling complex protein PhoU n=1 Tax=Microaerobacter geothermalis TaxID=674972 RepID=UPI001F3C758F|nr:phosphate signaling complex protein PhoU [Microaerobacter geothermalis]MCF6093716.1 phosphate signaling complex protein PhoU [Microaerobacter geothermalis]
MNREAYSRSLNELKEKLLRMAEAVEISIDQSVRSLANLDKELAQKTLDRDVEIDQMDLEIGNKAITLIATQQPVAKDLRKIAAAMHISKDLERMADLACNLARVTIDFVDENLTLYKPLVDIPNMAKLTQEMVHDGINSYITENVDLARKMAEKDDEVDRIYQEILDELVEYMTENNKHIKEAMKFAFVARFLERMSDLATNIGEYVTYIVEAKKADLN